MHREIVKSLSSSNANQKDATMIAIAKSRLYEHGGEEDVAD